MKKSAFLKITAFGLIFLLNAAPVFASFPSAPFAPSMHPILAQDEGDGGGDSGGDGGGDSGGDYSGGDSGGDTTGSDTGDQGGGSTPDTNYYQQFAQPILDSGTDAFSNAPSLSVPTLDLPLTPTAPSVPVNEVDTYAADQTDSAAQPVNEVDTYSSETTDYPTDYQEISPQYATQAPDPTSPTYFPPYQAIEGYTDTQAVAQTDTSNQSQTGGEDDGVTSKPYLNSAPTDSPTDAFAASKDKANGLTDQAPTANSATQNGTQVYWDASSQSYKPVPPSDSAASQSSGTTREGSMDDGAAPASPTTPTTPGTTNDGKGNVFVPATPSSNGTQYDGGFGAPQDLTSPTAKAQYDGGYGAPQDFAPAAVVAKTVSNVQSGLDTLLGGGTVSYVNLTQDGTGLLTLPAGQTPPPGYTQVYATAGGDGISTAPPLISDQARTANDADLGGYNGGSTAPKYNSVDDLIKSLPGSSANANPSPNNPTGATTAGGGNVASSLGYQAYLFSNTQGGAVADVYKPILQAQYQQLVQAAGSSANLPSFDSLSQTQLTSLKNTIENAGGNVSAVSYQSYQAVTAQGSQSSPTVYTGGGSIPSAPTPSAGNNTGGYDLTNTLGGTTFVGAGSSAPPATAQGPTGTADVVITNAASVANTAVNTTKTVLSCAFGECTNGAVTTAYGPQSNYSQPEEVASQIQQQQAQYPTQQQAQNYEASQAAGQVVPASPLSYQPTTPVGGPAPAPTKVTLGSLIMDMFK